MDVWWLEPKLSTAQEIFQIQMENPVKCMKFFAFSRKIVFVLSNQRLGIHSDNIWAVGTTKNTLNYLTTYLADPHNQPKY